MRHEVVDELVAKYIPANAYAEQWDAKGLHEECLRVFNLDLPIVEWAKEEGIDDAEIRERLIEAADRKMAEKAANYGPEVMRMAEKSMLLQHPRPVMEGAPAGARLSAPGHRPARLRPARSRSTSTSARPSRCSRPCWCGCASR